MKGTAGSEDLNDASPSLTKDKEIAEKEKKIKWWVSSFALIDILMSVIKIISPLADVLTFKLYFSDTNNEELSASHLFYNLWRLKNKKSKIKYLFFAAIRFIVLAANIVATYFSKHPLIIVALGLAAAPLLFFIASWCAVIHLGFILANTLVKSTRWGLLRDRSLSIKKLQEKIERTPKENAQLAYLTTQQQILPRAEKAKQNWERVLIRELLQHERQKITKSSIAFTLTLTTAILATVMLFAPPTAPIIGVILTAMTITLISFRIYNLCNDRFNQWLVQRAKKLLAVKKLDESSLKTRYFLKDNQLNGFNLTAAEREQYFSALSPAMREEKLNKTLLDWRQEQFGKENRGKLIWQWYQEEFLDTRNESDKTKMSAVKQWVKRILFALISPLTSLTALAFYTSDLIGAQLHPNAWKKPLQSNADPSTPTTLMDTKKSIPLSSKKEENALPNLNSGVEKPAIQFPSLFVSTHCRNVLNKADSTQTSGLTHAIKTYQKNHHISPAI